MRAVIEFFAWLGVVARRIVVDAARGIRTLAVRALTFAEQWLTASSKAMYGVAVARIGLGLTALLMLAANFSTRYYSFGSGVVWSGERIEPISDFPKIPVFSMFYNASLNDGAFTALYIFMMLLSVVVILGYRMKITLLVFFCFWTSFSEMTDFIGDQGDNIFRMATIALLFMDTSARWSLDARRRRKYAPQFAERPVWWGLLHGERIFPEWVRNVAHNLGLIVITAQVSFIYVAGSLYKAGGYPWSSGQAIYSPIHVDRFGTWPVLSDITTAWDPVVGILTYGALLTQLAFPFLLLNKWTRKVGIISITGVHIGIGILMGLPFFSLTMIALDMIFVSDKTWAAFAAWLRSVFAVPKEWVRPERVDATATPVP